MDPIIFRKAESVSRCIKRIEQEKQFNLFEDIVHQDALLLNLQLACQPVIDIGAYLVKTKQYGTPGASYEILEILFEHHIICFELFESLRAMVGFRNIMVHSYTELDLQIMMSIVENHLYDLQVFSRLALNQV